MITDHAFVGRSEWGIDPPALSPCQVCGLPRSGHFRSCSGVLIIKGESFGCEMVAPHDGWAHANKKAEAIWGEGKDEKG
jgi:hypothetical protein